MKDYCIVVSKCIDQTKFNKLKVQERWTTDKSLYQYYFHFKGSYCGHKIAILCIFDSVEKRFEEDEEYVLHVQVLHVKQGVLYAQVLQSQKLDEIRV